ncbi:hypothetical protein [Exiguobacterium sp. s194]|uniref:hypothetical protein n=1 Tax=Exiguobacterium sp. s194 TaxID=2751230 RepID=UPI001BE63828|nr:hypothetical protein [Exiguobacterium sp. s194]
MNNVEQQIILEIQRAGMFMQSYRPNKPFDNLELAYGLMAYQDWLDGAMQIVDSFGMGEEIDNYLYSCNQTARDAAINLMRVEFSDPGTLNAISRSRTINPSQELNLANNPSLSSYNPYWETCLTRAVILLCRQMAYFFTGREGDVFEFIDKKNCGRREVNGTAVKMFNSSIS